MQYITYAAGTNQVITRTHQRTGSGPNGSGVAAGTHVNMIVNETVTTYRDAPRFDLNRIYDVADSG